MAMTQSSVVIGVFADETQARHAIDELQRAGYTDDEVGYLTRATTDDTATQHDMRNNAAPGAIGGSVLGGVLGAAASLLIPGFGPAIAGGVLAATLGGMFIGASAGGLIGMLTGMGFSQDEGHFYQHELEAGRTIVTVKSEDGAADALNILRSNGASDARTRLAAFNAPQTLRPRANEELPPGEG